MLPNDNEEQQKKDENFIHSDEIFYHIDKELLNDRGFPIVSIPVAKKVVNAYFSVLLDALGTGKEVGIYKYGKMSIKLIQEKRNKKKFSIIPKITFSFQARTYLREVVLPRYWMYDRDSNLKKKESAL